MRTSGKAYICSAGETFDSVALAYFGDEKYAAELLCANPELCRVMVFGGGEKLRLPIIDIPAGGGQAAAEAAPWRG